MQRYDDLKSKTTNEVEAVIKNNEIHNRVIKEQVSDPSNKDVIELPEEEKDKQIREQLK